MARRKIGAAKRRSPAKRKTTTRRRRRVGGIGKMDMQGMLMTVVGLGAGAIAARELSNVALKMFSTLSPAMIGAGQIGVGLILPMLVKSKIGQDIGNGMVAFGVQVEAVSFGFISGLPGTTRSYRVSGTSNLRVISGTSNLRTIAGPNNRVQNNPSRNFKSTY